MLSSMIVETLVVGPFATNCYIVASELTKRGMIIDPGAQAKNILQAVGQSGVSISVIVLTHAHIDHFGALKAVRESTRAEFAAFTAQGAKTSPKGPVQIMKDLVFIPFTLPIKPDISLQEEDTIEIDDLHFSVLYTPGHSSDSISLSGRGVVFTGDTLLNHGIGSTHVPGCSYKQLIDSIREKLFVLPNDTIVYPGHGPPTTIGEEREHNPFLLP
jgi:glyoxylase-like metal-dependent hydrolase (beta-lactamase superfamily II)